MSYEIYWRNPVIDLTHRVTEVPDEATAQERVAHYAAKYGGVPGYQPAEYRKKPGGAGEGQTGEPA